MKLVSICSIQLVLVLIAITRTSCDDSTDPKGIYEPQFPYLIDPTNPGAARIKIVSESVEDKQGYKLQEEYVDLSAGRSAMVSANKDGNQVMFLDAISGKSYSYKPYSCEVKKISELPQVEDGLHKWNHKLMLQVSGEDSDDDRAPGSGRLSYELRLYGVAGLWKFAEERPKSFARENQLVYSASKDVYQESICWTVHDSELKVSVKFHFLEGPANPNGAPKLSLEMVQVESTSDKNVVRTINVLSIDREIDSETYDDYLDVPVGYGCFEREADPVGGNKEKPDENPLDGKDGPNAYWNRLFLDPQTSVADLEITATKFETNLKGGTVSRSSDTMSIQLVHSIIESSNTLESVRIRNTERDYKIFSNHKYSVKYTVDLRRGTCSLSHTISGRDTEAARDELLQFNNGLQLDVVRNHFDLFDYSSNKFHFIKKTRASEGRFEQYFYENTANMAAFRELDLSSSRPNQTARIIRSYTKSSENSGIQLSSLSIWVLNDDQNRLEETYQINVIDARFIKGWPEEPKAFDVSQECYLNSDNGNNNNGDLDGQYQMKSGRDYAWVELTYPASSRVLGLVAANEMYVKQFFYSNYLKSKGMDFTRVPRMELLFDNEDSFVIRMLLLDTPPLQFVYRKYPKQVISLDREAGDSSHMAPDLRHCADLCRLSYCTQMSFCHGSMSCLLSSRKVDRMSENASDQPESLKPMETCDTYTLPLLGVSMTEFDLDYFHSSSLHGILSRLQHQDYSITSLPKVPDELALPRGETLISDEDYEKARSDYVQSLIVWLHEESANLPELTISTILDDHFMVLLPNKFEIENDPLRDFDIVDKDSMDSMSDVMGSSTLGGDADPDKLPAFHQGLPMHRYKVNPTTNAKLGDQDVSLSLMNGLSYDQCALACLDGRCGSFSYCKVRKECILSSMNTTGRAQALDMVEQDPECFIAQRDFLSNFVKFSNVYRPQLYEALDNSVTLSDCALGCVSQTDFRCLAFDFCQQPDEKGRLITNGPGWCYYHKNRNAGFQNIQPASGPNKTGVEPFGGVQTTGCSHYARSYLGDYNRVEYRRLAQDVLQEMKTNQIDGQNVFRCAEMCSSELIDCTAFQFCFNSASEGAKQVCTMIESKPADKSLEDMSAIIDEGSGKVLKAGKYLEHDTNCHLFALRRDSSEAHLRDLALGGTMTVAEQEAEARRKVSAGSMSLFWLYVVVSLVSVVVGLGVSFVRENKDTIGQRIRQTGTRIRLNLGLF